MSYFDDFEIENLKIHLKNLLNKLHLTVKESFG